MTNTSRAPDPESTFAALYGEIYPDLLRFVQRRAHPSHAEDVVAEAFLVMWRRFDEVPQRPGDARAWVFGVARNLLLNTQRGETRRRGLGVQLADATPAVPRDDPHLDLVVSRIDLARAWTRLSAVHQEALALSAFDGLTASEAAAVIGTSPVAYRLRLSRARRALRAHLTHLPPSGLTADSSERSTTHAC